MTTMPSNPLAASRAALSDVQLANLTLLLTIRDGILHDRASACLRFALDASQADRLAQMSIQQAMALVAHLGDATLFPPRRDLVQLLDTPPALVRPVAAVHPALAAAAERAGVRQAWV